MRFPLYIAKRYLFSKSGTNAINIITLISVISIIIGTAVLFIVLSGFAGLKDYNISVTSIIDPDIKILPSSGKTITITPEQEKKLAAITGIQNYSKVIEERVYLEYDGKTHLGFIKGVDQNYLKVTNIDTTLFAGSWPSIGEPEVVISIGIRRRLSLGISDYGNLLRIMVPKPGTGQITDPTSAFNRSSAVASGIFQAGESLDNDHLFSNIDFVGELLDYPLDKVSTLELKLTQDANEAEIRNELETIFLDTILIKNRTELNDALYKMLNTENLALYFICTLVLIIALFSFVGSIIMIIIDKKGHIKTLSDLGATLTDIRRSFFYQGALMIILGGGIGLFIGSIIVLIQQQFGLVNITASLPYPMRFEFLNLLIVYATILVLGILAARLASSRINNNFLTTN
ncbi:membrane protein [Dokdonia pacifica]|uniref:Lipoprotein-releasing system permease protein n=1 Tax=Dokdonia pacifica TaxID=1627892 RepID=A0A239AF06_9FLAO|nr:FtsX-like permease family protein [Dokdonia pacifica]GGG37819.1 membrane protein [Dokdonia pacifica]SNR94237.1 lipoprotein-releasing system permease protein [Dokdonia pacifica]